MPDGNQLRRSRQEQIGVIVIITFIGCLIIIVQYIGTINSSPPPLNENYNIETGVLAVDNLGGENVVPLVENRSNIHKGISDTPTLGMLAGVTDTTAPAETAPAIVIPTPGGFDSEHSKFCANPTGFLLAIKNAYDKGDRFGLVRSDNVVVDMGHAGSGAFYDTNGDGCCDTYCRKVIKGGNWSCISPQSITTQYETSLPRGTKCEGGYNMLAKTKRVY